MTTNMAQIHTTITIIYAGGIALSILLLIIIVAILRMR